MKNPTEYALQLIKQGITADTFWEQAQTEAFITYEYMVQVVEALSVMFSTEEYCA